MAELVLYTIGYGGRQPWVFFSLLPAECELIDVRVSPRGWHASYCRESLLERFRGRYFWYRSLGNVSDSADVWQPPLGCAFSTEEALETVGVHVTHSLRPLVLLCAEADPQHCHRRLVAEAVAARVPGLRVVHLGVPAAAQGALEFSSTLSPVAGHGELCWQCPEGPCEREGGCTHYQGVQHGEA